MFQNGFQLYAHSVVPTVKMSVHWHQDQKHERVFGWVCYLFGQIVMCTVDVGLPAFQHVIFQKRVHTRTQILAHGEADRRQVSQLAVRTGHPLVPFLYTVEKVVDVLVGLFFGVLVPVG